MTDKTLTCKDCGAQLENKNSTKKKDSITNQRDVQLVEELRKHNKAIDNY